MDSKGKELSNIFSRNWWKLLLRGLAAITFGVLSWVLPGVSLEVLVLLFGAFVFVDGIFGTWMAIEGRKGYDDWWVLLLWGLVGIGMGTLTFLAPGVTAVALLFFVVVWAISTGVLEIVVAIRLRKEIKDEWLLILGGLLSVVFGVLLMAHPGAGALALMWLIGTFAVAFGFVLVSLAFKVRSFGKQFAAHEQLNSHR